MNAIAPSLQGKIEALERELLSMPQADIRTTHTFLPGIYERTITIPPWTVLTGARHKTAYRVRLEKGVIAVNTDDGVKILTAPCEIDARSGAKRAGRVFAEEVIWTDVYQNPDDCTDLNELESRLYDLEDCELGENVVKARIERDRDDYQLFLSQVGLSQAEMNAIVTSEDGEFPLVESIFPVELRDSRIHGKGLFALVEFSPGQFICSGRIDGRRTLAGRFINHSADPNAVTVKSSKGDLGAVALRVIRKDEEITLDYRGSMRVNLGLILEGEKPCQVG